MDELGAILEAWRAERHVDLAHRMDEGKDYFELTWRKPDETVTRYIDVYPQNGIAIVQHGTFGYEGNPERQRGTIMRLTYGELPKVLSELQPLVEEMPARPWKYTPKLRDQVVTGLKFR